MRWVLLALCLAGCHKPLPPPVPPSQADGGATCEAACAHLRALGCPSAQPTADNSCTLMCSVPAGLQALNVNCILSASSCEAADNCDNIPDAGS